MKKGIHNMQTQIQQLNKIRENQMAHLSKSVTQQTSNQNAHEIQDSLQHDQAEMKYQQALLDKVKELEARVSRLESQTQ